MTPALASLLYAKYINSNISTILDHLGSFWTLSEHLGPFQTIVDYFRPSWTISDHLGPFQIFPRYPGGILKISPIVPPRHPPDNPQTTPIYTPNIYKVSPRHPPDILPHIYSARYRPPDISQNLAQISPSYSKPLLDNPSFKHNIQ